MTTPYFSFQRKKFGRVREANIFLPELDLYAWLRGVRLTYLFLFAQQFRTDSRISVS